MKPQAGSERGVRRYELEHRQRAAHRKVVAAYADWLKLIAWQLFCTFTFAWRVSDAQAIEIFTKFIKRLEGDLAASVCYVRGDEKRISGCGKPACARHFHVLLASSAIMNAKAVEALWMSMAGNRSDGAGAVALPYDPNLDGIAYVLKWINHPDGDWDLAKVDLFDSSNDLQNVSWDPPHHSAFLQFNCKNFSSPLSSSCAIEFHKAEHSLKAE